MPYHLSKAQFAMLVEAALAELPPPFDGYLEEISIEIRDRPSGEEMGRLKLGKNDLLLGLYHGRPLTRRSVQDEMTLPDIIYIFQNNIEQLSSSENTLKEQVRKTVLHEIGHHFGMSEEDLDELGYG
ncbi:MAG TPA: metallopeptidase family protein [Tepidisphaeraceae bacterium]|jgi:predicted Zn-dependent protease with MMP-like domain|nr:metallopeptidase family protein [Tepidisphaeraceae bacterium]